MSKRTTEAQNGPAPRGRPEYIGRRESFNAWLVRLAGERAAQVQADLARADAAPISGTVERLMTTTTKTKSTAKTAKTTAEMEPEKRPIGRPPTGRKSVGKSVTLSQETWDWLDEKGGGPGTGNKLAAKIIENYRKRAK